MAKTTKNPRTIDPTLPPVTRVRFKAKAKPFLVEIDGYKLILSPKEFRGKSGEVDGTGSLGWFVQQKFVVTVDDIPLLVQANFQLIVQGTKEEEA